MTQFTCSAANLENLKNSSCAFNFKVIRNIIFLKQEANDDTKNGFATLAELTKSNFLAKLLEVDKSKRFYVCEGGLFEEVTDETAENLTQEYASGRIDFLKDGVRSFSGLKPELSPLMKKKIESHRASKDLAAFLIDDQGNLGFVTNDAGTGVYPCPINSGSLNVLPVSATFEANNGMNIGFNFSDKFKFENFSYAKIEDLDLIDDLFALNTVTATEVTALTTAITVDLANEYGVPIAGLTSANVTATDTADDSDVPISTVAEDATIAGRYVITFTTPGTAADVYKLTWVNAVDGREDYEQPNAQTYTLA